MEDETVLPVAAEHLRVEKRATTRTVRVHKRVRVEQSPIEETVTDEGVEVQRVPVDRIVDAPPSPYRDGDTWVWPVVEEILVVQRRYRVREEVRVTPTKTSRSVSTTVERRFEEVEVEREPEDPHPGTV